MDGREDAAELITTYGDVCRLECDGTGVTDKSCAGFD